LELPDNLLSTAVIYAKPSAVEELLERGLDPDIESEGSFGTRTALYYALFECAKSRSTGTQTALHYALFEFAKTRSTGTLITYAGYRGAFKSIVQILLKYKANVRTTDKDGNQPLHSMMARQYRNEDIDDQYKELFDLLLTSGADLNAVNKFQRSPLWIAASCLEYSMVSFLLSRGANHLSESQLTSLATYFETRRDVNFGSVTQADAEKMMEFLAKKAAEPICQPPVPTPALLANGMSDLEDRDT
jgi:ankyrin repeat protein